jgi:transcriptional regulator with XRE-family HTH domain
MKISGQIGSTEVGGSLSLACHRDGVLVTSAERRIALRLAARLRQLREREWPDAGLTQAQLASALSRQTKVAPATISSWESQASPKSPPQSRLSAYARIFATERSLEGGPHLLDLDEFTPGELERFHELHEELLGLLQPDEDDEDDEEPPRRTLLKFAEGPVVIICPEVPLAQRGKLADERSPNFTQLHQYADLDALLNVHGHIRALNPELRVVTRLPSTMRTDELQNHLVLLGGVGWNKTTKRILASLEQLPIEQIEHPRLTTGDVFRLRKSFDPGETLYFPVMGREAEDEPEELVEDCALVAQLPNPYNTNRTLTVLNGIHSRGVVGAVQTIADDSVRLANEQYLARRFPSGSFALLARVLVLSGYALAPDLQNPDTRIFEWPVEAGE